VVRLGDGGEVGMSRPYRDRVPSSEGPPWPARNCLDLFLRWMRGKV
jgi:hypothetical protein